MGERDAKRGRGTEGTMAPEADTLYFCGRGGSAPRGPGLRPGHSSLHASLASHLRATFLPSHFLI